jgi:1,4-alpha-glucan branching enzyme
MLEKENLSNGRVRVNFSVPSCIWADQIALVGEFNGWSAEGHLLQRSECDANWHIALELEAGRSYRFHYLIDGKEWMEDDRADGYEPSPQGAVDSVVRI